MHSRIFNVTKDRDFISEENTEDVESMCEKMQGRADYVTEDDCELEGDVQWLLASLKKKHDIKVFNTKDGIEYIELPYNVIREFIKEENKNKLKKMNAMLKVDMPKFMEYLRTGKLETGKLDNDISYLTYKIKDIIESKTNFYINAVDYGLMTLDNAISDYFEDVKVGESVYIFQTLNYHF